MSLRHRDLRAGLVGFVLSACLSGCGPHDNGSGLSASDLQRGMPVLSSQSPSEQSAPTQNTELAQTENKEATNAPESFSSVYDASIAQVQFILVKLADTEEDTLDIDAALYDAPGGESLGLLNCARLAQCNDYVMDIAQQNVAVFEVRYSTNTQWARIHPNKDYWVKVQPPFKLLSFEALGTLIEMPRQGSLVCVAPGVGCSELDEKATLAGAIFRAAQANAVHKLIRIAAKSSKKAKLLSGFEDNASLAGYDKKDLIRAGDFYYVPYELPTLKDVSRAIDSLNNTEFGSVGMEELAAKYPAEFNAYREAKRRYQQVLGMKVMWIRTRDSANIPTVYSKTS